MESYGHVIHAAIIGLMVIVTWAAPRSWGLLGLIAAHLLCALGFIAMAYVSLLSGIWPSYEGGLVIFGLLIQAFIFNVLLLPLGVWAMIRWRRLSPRSALYNANREVAPGHRRK